MTKSTGVGRGGRRPGAGRKKAPKRARREIPATLSNIADVEALARTHTLLAVQALAEIALNGEKEAARVAAANALLDRGHGKVGGAAGGVDGKKAQRQANAERSASGGRFAAPVAPRLVVSNGK